MDADRIYFECLVSLSSCIECIVCGGLQELSPQFDDLGGCVGCGSLLFHLLDLQEFVAFLRYSWFPVSVDGEPKFSINFLLLIFVAKRTLFPRH